jgi:hypothetical protein
MAISKLWLRRNLGAPRGQETAGVVFLSPRTAEGRCEAEEGLAIPPHRCHSPPAGFSGEAVSPKVPSDWRLTWLLLGVIVGLLGLIMIDVVAKRYL